MKPYILSAAILFFIAGITLAGNSWEVTGQSALDEAQDILGTTENATANATGELMNRADNVLGLASDAASNATADAIKKTMNLLSNISNNVTDTGLNTSSNLTEPINATQKVLKKYENGKYGISFQYPSEWKEPFDFGCEDPTQTLCGPHFNFLDFVDDLPSISVSIIELDKPSVNAKSCNCNTLKDFITWDYIRTENENRTFVNDNQTVLGRNYSAWQTETEFSDVGNKHFDVYAINGNVGYKFDYSAPADNRFNQHLDEFKNMLKTVTFTTPIPEKKPSFLNSSDIQNSSILSSTPKVQDEPIKIASSNDFIDSLGFLHVVGEIENNSPSNIQFVKVSGTFYDSNNQVVGTGLTYTNPSDIGSGQKAPFELLLTSASIPVSEIDHYNLVASHD